LYGDPVGFDREYGCQFTGDLESLLKWAQLIEAGEKGRDLPFSFLRGDGAGFDPNFFKQELPGGGRLDFGWDVARTGDLSALWANHRAPGRQVYLRFLVVMHRVSFELQRTVVFAGMDARGYGSGVGAGDATGLGMDSNET